MACITIGSWLCHHRWQCNRSMHCCCHRWCVEGHISLQISAPVVGHGAPAWLEPGPGSSRDGGGCSVISVLMAVYGAAAWSEPAPRSSGMELCPTLSTLMRHLRLLPRVWSCPVMPLVKGGGDSWKRITERKKNCTFPEVPGLVRSSEQQ